jgi:hypothetical protein
MPWKEKDKKRQYMKKYITDTHEKRVAYRKEYGELIIQIKFMPIGLKEK